MCVVKGLRSPRPSYAPILGGFAKIDFFRSCRAEAGRYAGPVRDFTLSLAPPIDYLDRGSKPRRDHPLRTQHDFPPLKDLPPNCVLLRFKFLGREFIFILSLRRLD
jgi:hypothetical protein